MRRALKLVLDLFVVVFLVGTVPCAEAQLLDVPPFVAIDASLKVRFGSYTMAPADDSSMVVLASTWSDIARQRAVLQRFSSAGSALGTLLRLDETGDISRPFLIADTRGGFLASWRGIGGYLLPLYGRMLGPTGVPTGPVFTTVPYPFTQITSIALPSGSAFVWTDDDTIKARRYDVAGVASGPEIVVASIAPFTVFYLRVAAKSDGGFVVGWAENGRTRGRVYDAAAAPLGDAFILAEEFEVNDLAASPLGGFVAVGRRQTDTHTWPSGVWARRFDDGGTPTGPAFLVDFLDPALLGWPRARFDDAGRLYVVWGIRFSSEASPHARLYGADGTTLQAPFKIADEPASEVLLERRPDGRFMEGWVAFGGDLKLQVRTLCVPPDHTGCGNGVVEAPCERCDAGPANSDTTPDACRTACMRPSCGDGVIDQGESCDDGNLVGCDGCDATCETEVGYVCGDGIVSSDCEEQCDDGPANDDTVPNACRTSCLRAHCNDGVLDDGEGCDDANGISCDGCSDHCVPEPGLTCGDGIPELACGEQCDDGNGITGDGCVESCRLERVPGGGSPASDCKVEWVIDNPTNVPLYDKHGGINGTQTCADGDPRCDFDGGVPGSCTFHLRVCANNTDLPACTAGPRLRSWELRAPSAAKAAAHPALAAVRTAFTSVPGVIVGPTVPDVCSGTLDVVVPVRAFVTGAKAGSLILKSYATLYTGEKDSDKLKLICMP